MSVGFPARSESERLLLRARARSFLRPGGSLGDPCRLMLCWLVVVGSEFAARRARYRARSAKPPYQAAAGGFWPAGEPFAPRGWLARLAPFLSVLLGRISLRGQVAACSGCLVAAFGVPNGDGRISGLSFWRASARQDRRGGDFSVLVVCWYRRAPCARLAPFWRLCGGVAFSQHLTVRCFSFTLPLSWPEGAFSFRISALRNP